MIKMQRNNSEKLQDAIRSLGGALAYARSGEFHGLGIEFKSVLISAVVQNFNLTFALCREMLSQRLSEQLGSAAIEEVPSQEILRMAAKEGIISNLNRWMEYLDCEHLSPSSNLALRTFEKASSFLEDASELLRTCTPHTHTQTEPRRVA